jgi:hypothetical protein
MTPRQSGSWPTAEAITRITVRVTSSMMIGRGLVLDTPKRNGPYGPPAMPLSLRGWRRLATGVGCPVCPVCQVPRQARFMIAKDFPLIGC